MPGARILAVLAKTGVAAALGKDDLPQKMFWLNADITQALSSSHGQLDLIERLPPVEDLLSPRKGMAQRICRAAKFPIRRSSTR